MKSKAKRSNSVISCLVLNNDHHSICIADLQSYAHLTCCLEMFAIGCADCRFLEIVYLIISFKSSKLKVISCKLHQDEIITNFQEPF